MGLGIQTPRLIANTAWSFTGNTVYAICQWAMLVLLARLGNPQMVGHFALGLAIAAPVFLFANLQLRAIQTTDMAGEFSFADYLGMRIATSIASLFLIGGVILFSGYRGQMAEVILAVSTAKAFEAVSDVFHGELQRRERMDRIAIYLGIKGVLAVAAVAAGMKVLGNATGAAMGMALVFGTMLLLVESRFSPAPLAVRWNWQILRKLGLMGLPLGAAMMLISLNLNIPRYFIGESLGPYALGVFAALTYLSVAASTVVNALGLAATPRLARYFALGDHDMFRRTLLQMGAGAAALGLGGLAVLAIAGRPVLALVYGKPYADHLNVALWVIAAGGISCLASVIGYGMTAARCFRPQLPLFAAVAAITAAAAFLLVPRYGLMGAAAAQLISAVAQMLGSACILAFHFRTKSTKALPLIEVAA
jgi:O-antigen/teichoic acid export membrane protein